MTVTTLKTVDRLQLFYDLLTYWQWISVSVWHCKELRPTLRWERKAYRHCTYCLIRNKFSIVCVPKPDIIEQSRNYFFLIGEPQILSYLGHMQGYSAGKSDSEA